MSLPVGTRIASYDVQSLLGVGGMGEVYRAHDSKLRRDVALKILPSAFAADTDRLIRFKREAQILASLNHPHIAAIYGFEESNGIHVLVWNWSRDRHSPIASPTDLSELKNR